MGVYLNSIRGGVRIAAGLVLLSGVSSCKKAENSGQYVCGDADRSAYISQSHEYRPDQGDSVRSVRSASPVVDGYFGKPYNQDWLSAIGHSSILDTVDYVESKGVRVYKAEPVSQKSSHVFTAASTMTWDIDREWRLADQPLAGTSCGFLAGLYLGRGKMNYSTKKEIPSLKNEAAIVVREDTGRWTLVHEFMHHNFRTQANAQGYSDNRLQLRYRSVNAEKSALESNKALSNREYARRMSALFLQYVDIVDELIVHYYFEEVAIEALLQDQYASGKLQYVSGGAFENANRYINQSKKVVLEVYRGMNATYDKLFRLTSTNGLFTEMKQIAHYTELRDQRLDQLSAVIDRHKAPAIHGLFSMTGEILPADESIGAVMPCAHAQEIEGQFSEIALMMQLLIRRTE